MKHLGLISRKPMLAQSSPLCNDIDNTSQAKLCFTLEFLTAFVLPVYDLKRNITGQNGGNGANGENGAE